MEARSTDDGIIEAVRLTEYTGHKPGEIPYVVGVQWHPEFQQAEQNTLLAADAIMAEFMRESRRRKQEINQYA